MDLPRASQVKRALPVIFGLYVSILSAPVRAGCSDISGNTICDNDTLMDGGTVYANQGLWVPDIGNYGPNSFPKLTAGIGTWVGRDLYMMNMSPQVSWFNTGAGHAITPNDAGYNIYENISGQLEINAINPDGSNPQTLCEFNFFQAGAPLFGCAGSLESSNTSGDTSDMGALTLSFKKAGAASNDKNWWLQVTSDTNMDVRYVTDAQDAAGLGARFTRSGSSPAGVTFYKSDSTSTALGTDGSGNTTVGGTLTVSGIKATTGNRYVCVDTSGNFVSQATACSGT